MHTIYVLYMNLSGKFLVFSQLQASYAVDTNPKMDRQMFQLLLRSADLQDESPRIQLCRKLLFYMLPKSRFH